MWENRSKLLFISSVLISGLIFLQMGMYVLHVLLNWDLPLNLFQICNDQLRAHGFTWVGYVLDALVFYTILFSFWKTVRQLLFSHKVYQNLLSNREEAITWEINQRYGGNGDFLVVLSQKPIAVTMGLVKPKIILSTGLLQLLERNEVEAVINHELFHKKHRDPCKTFVLSLFSSVIWYLPILKWMQKKYHIIREVLADNHAIHRSGGSSVDLGSALLKLLKSGSLPDIPFSYVSFADTSIHYRIKQILDSKTELSLELPLAATIVSVYVLFVLCNFFIRALS